MSEFAGPPMSWYEPPTIHEVCTCEDCHECGEHEDDVEQWAKWGCGGCEDKVMMNNFH